MMLIASIGADTLRSYTHSDDPAAWRSNYTLIDYLTNLHGMKETGCTAFSSEDIIDGEWKEVTLQTIRSTLSEMKGLCSIGLDGLWGDHLLVEFDGSGSEQEVAIATVGDHGVAIHSMGRSEMIDHMIAILRTGDGSRVGSLFGYAGMDGQKCVIEDLVISKVSVK